MHHNFGFNYNICTNNNINNNINNNNNNISNNNDANKNDQETRQDVIFRKVRGILNKITPEKFDKLSKDLTNVGLDSPKTLRGVIYLIFDKALKDLKYSSLYAKLCQELSERVPNFEQNKSGPNTFCKFLISKCEDEFARRRKATEDFDNKLELTDEEFELRAIAKQKMLGNIKFICELGKKRLLQEEILYECIRELLSKKKERSIQDQIQDLECLCQIMRTIGSLLDVQNSKNLMNQYFERINLYSEKKELPSRIRFMLRDIIDLRKNNWKLRPFQREDNAPQPLSKLREDIRGFDPNLTGTGLSSALTDKFGNNKNLVDDLSKLNKGKLSMLLDDEPSFTTSTDFHWGPQSFLPFEEFNDFTSTKPRPTTDNYDSTKSKAPFGSSNSTNNQPPPFSRSPVEAENNISKMTNPGPALYRPPQPRVSNHPVPNKEVSNQNQRNIINKYPSNAPNIANNPPPHALAETDRMVRPRPQSPNRPNNDFHHQQSFDHNHPDSRQRNPRFFDNNRGPPRGFHNNRNYNNSPPPQAGARRPFNEPYNQQHNNIQHPSQNNHQYPNRYSPPHYGSNLNQGPKTQSTVFNDGPRQFNNNHRNPTMQQSHAPDFRPDRRDGQGRFLNSYRPRGQYHDHNSQGFRRHSPGPPEATHYNSSATSSNFYNNRNPPAKTQDSYQRPPTLPQQPINQKVSTQPFKPRSNDIDPPLVRPQPRQITNNLNLQNNNADNDNDNTSNVPQKQVGNEVNRSLPPRQNHPSSSFPVRPVGYNFSNIHLDQSKPESRFRDGPGQKFFERQVTPGNLPPNQRSYQQSPPRFSSTNLNRKIANVHQQPANSAQPLQSRNNFVVPTKEPAIDTKPLFLSKTSTTNRVNDVNFSLRPTYKMPGRQPETINANNSKMNAGDNSIPRTQFESNNDDRDIKSNKQSHFQENVQANASKQHQPNPESTVTQLDSKSNQVNSPGCATTTSTIHTDKFKSLLDSEFKACSSSTWNLSNIISKVKEFKIPKNNQQDCLVHAMEQSILRSDKDRENVSKLFACLIPSVFDHSSLIGAFKVIFDKLNALEIETPRVKSLVAGLLSQAVLSSVISFEDVGVLLKDGKHHPLFLLFLQQLDKSAGQAWLNDKYLASKINLMQMLPEVDQTRDRLAKVLKDRSLGFLDPMLTIEPDLWQYMKEKDASPAGVYRWVKDNVHSTIQESPAFAHVLISCLLKYIHEAAASHYNNKLSTKGDKGNATDEDNQHQLGDNKDNTVESESSSKSTPTTNSSSSQGALNELEKEYLGKYQQILHALLKDKQMQLACLYSLQAFYFKLDFPKGSLLRWFDMLYDLNIIDEDVFFTWKEEINDEFPGKGQALFQVNTWLNWLAEAESEDDEEEG